MRNLTTSSSWSPNFSNWPLREPCGWASPQNYNLGTFKLSTGRLALDEATPALFSDVVQIGTARPTAVTSHVSPLDLHDAATRAPDQRQIFSAAWGRPGPQRPNRSKGRKMPYAQATQSRPKDTPNQQSKNRRGPMKENRRRPDNQSISLNSQSFKTCSSLVTLKIWTFCSKMKTFSPL